MKTHNKDLGIYIFLLAGCLVYAFTGNAIIGNLMFVPGILIALNKNISKPAFCIYVLLFLGSDAMGLLPGLPIGSATLSWSDLGLVYAIFLFVLYPKCIPKRNSFLNWVVIILLILKIVAAIVGNIIYGQNILTGLMVYRALYIYLCFIPVSYLIKKGKIKKEQIINYILNFIKILSVSYAIQLLLLYLGIDITSFGYDFRWGYRLRASNVFQYVGILIIIYRLLKGDSKRNNLLWLLVFSVELVFINQSRIMILGSAVAIFIMILFSPVRRKYFLVIGAILIGGIVIAQPTVQRVILSSIVESESNTSGNFLYRQYEKAYFQDKLKGHEIFGVGTPNQNQGLAATYSGQKISSSYSNFYASGYYTTDLGIFCIEYHFGIVGLVLYWIMIAVLLIDCLKRYLLSKKFSLETFTALGIILMCVIVSYTLCFFISRPILFLIMFIFLESEHNGKERLLRNENG